MDTEVEMRDAKTHPVVERDPFLVVFEEPFDKENPQDWKAFRKWAVTGVLSASSFNRIMISTIMAPALSTIGTELNMTGFEAVMAMSAYLLAAAFGPLIIAPLAETWGRSPVLHTTNVWFLVWNILCGFAKNKETLIAARFLAGLGASAVYALVGGVLSDVWRPEHRGRGLGLYALFPLLGAAVGPIIGGFVVQSITWRWLFWLTSALQGLLIVLSFVFFRETYAPIILARKAARLRAIHGSSQYQTLTERFESGRSLTWKLSKSLSRPARLLLFHPIIQIQALLAGFSYGLLYLVLSTFADIWTKQYGQSLSMSGLHYISLCLGEIAGAEIGAPLLDYYFAKMKAKNNGIGVPEFRMPLMLPGAVIMPAGLFMFGWAARAHSHWMLVDTGAFLYSFGGQLSGQALTAYVIDCYSEHASSAAAATQFLRSLTAFSFPLFAPYMYEAMGYGWGNSLLAFLCISIGIPAPLLVWKYGAKLREKAQSSY